MAVSAIAPYDGRPLVHRFSTAVAAAEVTMAEAIDQGDRFSFTVAWVGLEEMDAPAPFRWELVGEDGLVAADGSGELTLEPGSLVLGRQSGGTDPAAPAGDYALRLALGDGESWEAGTITIRERARRYELPEMEIPLNADYGGLIRLEGADLVQEETLIRLTLYWRSQAAIPSDYLIFVHLFDPATEEIPVQHDALPRGNSYPMSQWAAGEVVDDPITLSLASVRPGLYRLGVGLYQQDGDQYPRLPAVDTDGQPVPAGRLVLPVEIIGPAIP